MILILTLRPKFPLGSMFATANAVATFPNKILIDCLNRHAAGDWGNLDPEDVKANEEALSSEGRLFSSYEIEGKGKLWCITEADRCATTLLLPEDY